MATKGSMLYAAVLLATPPALAGEPEAVGTFVAFTNPVTYEITQRITVTNQDVSALDMLELNLPIPLHWRAQHVGVTTIKGDRTFQLHDVHDLGAIVRSRYVDADVLPGPGESRSLEVHYSLSRKEIHANTRALSRRVYGPYDKNSAAYRLYTRGEKLIEVDAPEIVKQAALLASCTNSPYRFAQAAYHLVIDETRYVTPSPSLSALACLNNKKGDCGSYALLFVALCRARGIPARPVTGCWAEGDNQWHCWAEFQLPGVGWIPVDPTAGQRSPRDRAFYFGNLDNNRVTLAKTFNLTVDTRRGGTDLGFVQVGTWWWYPAPGSHGSRLAVEHAFHGTHASRSIR